MMKGFPSLRISLTGRFFHTIILAEVARALRIVTPNGRSFNVYRLRARRPVTEKEAANIVADYTVAAVNYGDDRKASV